MSANDIVTIIFTFIAGAILLYAAIKTGKDDFNEDFK